MNEHAHTEAPSHPDLESEQAYLYFAYVPPLEAAWLRERKRAKYLPKPKRRRR